MSIATQITRLQNIKAAIRQALVNKGITAASTHDMDDFATDIGSIPTGIDTSDATAYAANVVSPYTFYARGNKYTGSITPRSLTTGSNLGYSRIDSGYYSNSYSVSANSPIFESVYMSSSRQMSLTETHSVSRSPGDLTMVVLSTTNTDYTEEILQTTGGLAQGILAIGFIPSIDVMYVDFELRFTSNGMNYKVTISYSSGQYTVTLNSLPLSSYRPYFQVYRVANKGFSLS